ncbi:purple acid phosphatase 23-like [Phragmites australis]|uniref:purple acid phosphatase 23-like n=1 Tax=Phragmites australis TaxID=29695 RepID=UPI002D784D22|nr:purple acid phosphatase 23-like [Phragmites australis]
MPRNPRTLSWVTSRMQVGFDLALLDPAAIRSEVWYDDCSVPVAASSVTSYSHIATGSANYGQLYPYSSLLNYTSGAIHHVCLHGLRPAMSYYYCCGDSALPSGLSNERSFTMLPAAGAGYYSCRITVLGDLGFTGNYNATVEHLTKNDPSLILMVGDMTYANH